MFWLFFIQFSFDRPHSEHQWIPLLIQESSTLSYLMLVMMGVGEMLSISLSSITTVENFIPFLSKNHQFFPTWCWWWWGERGVHTHTLSLSHSLSLSLSLSLSSITTVKN
jgi:hypothetical protein